MKLSLTPFLFLVTVGGVQGQSDAPTAAWVGGGGDTQPPTTAAEPELINSTAIPSLIVDSTAGPSLIGDSTPDPIAGGQSVVPSDMPSVMPTGAGTPPPTFEGQISYLDEPEQEWTVQIDGTGTPDGPQVSKGNSVTVSPDGDWLYVTLSTGRLDVVRAYDGVSAWSYTPEPIAAGWGVMCNAGVSFGTSAADGPFVVYPVIDTPPTGSTEDYQSRIIAFSHTNGGQLWTSSVIPGQISGEVAVGDGGQYPGQYIYFTHNLNTTTAAPVGSFSLVKGSNGELLFSEVAGTNPDDPSIDFLVLPYAPVGIAQEATEGPVPGTPSNSPLLVWSTSDNGGFGGDGYTRAFQLPNFFDDDFAEALKTLFLKTNRWNAVAKPTLTPDGKQLYFAVRGNSLRAWTNQNGFAVNANVVIDLPPNPVEARVPIPYAPVLSADESTFYVASSNPIVYAFDAVSGTILWEVSGAVIASGPPSVTPDNKLVLISWEDGTVMAVNAADGTVAWTITCQDIVDEDGTTCSDSITGGSNAAPDGEYFYYGDVLGNVKSVQLTSNPTEGTAPPLPVIPTPFPSTIPSDMPSMMPSGIGGPTDPVMTPTESPVSGGESSPTIVEATDAPTEGEPVDEPADPPSGNPDEEELPSGSGGIAVRPLLLPFTLVVASIAAFW